MELRYNIVDDESSRVELNLLWQILAPLLKMTIPLTNDVIGDHDATALHILNRGCKDIVHVSVS